MIVIDIFWFIVDFIAEKLIENLKIVIILVVLILLVCLAT